MNNKEMTYEKTIWNYGDMITSEKLNKIENAIEEISKKEGVAGPQGEKGEKGDKGDKGEKGDPGLTSQEKEYLFQSVSNGKKLIASAITDKGVETSNEATFETMATNIRNIKGGSDTGLTEEEIEEAKYWKEETNWNHRFYLNKRSVIPNLNSSHVTSLDYTFFNNSNLTKIPLSDTSKATSMNSTFYYCNSFAGKIEVNTDSAQDISSIFSDCSNITEVNLTNTKNVRNFNAAFYNCSKLQKVSMLDTTNVKSMSSIFYGCSELTYITFNPDAGNMVDLDLSSCVKMTEQDLKRFVNSLPTTRNPARISLGSTLIYVISEEDKRIATNKGYSIYS